MNYFEQEDVADLMSAGHEPDLGSPPTVSHKDADSQSHGQSQPATSETASQHPRYSANVTIYQTTGPDAHTSAIMSPGGSHPMLNPRSCVTCRRRKVRCDKQMPCSNCRRAHIPCVFPAPGRAPRQLKSKDPNAPQKSSQREVELIKRLRKLEGIVEELSGQIEVESTAGAGVRVAHSESPRIGGGLTGEGFSHSHRSSVDFLGKPTSESGYENNSDTLRRREIVPQLGRMILSDQKGHKGAARYVSSGFWSKMNDEIDAIRAETQKLTNDGEDELTDFDESPTDTPDVGLGDATDQHGFLFGYRSTDTNLTKLYPLPSHATFLWSVYQENVEPLLKILHVPTTDLILRDARKNVALLSPANKALVFAIYFSAITALEPEEVLTNFGAEKFTLLAQYRFALEQALAKANFLNASDLTTLQAFILFLLVARRHDDSRFCWSMTGLAVRLAQGMGIHRDGTNFGLSPFETEMRRRIWWALVILDLRSAEEYGSDMAISDTSFDTQIPTNINDADISPESRELPEPREGVSDCAVAVARCEVCAMARRIHHTSASPNSKPDKNSIAEKEDMLIEVYRKIEHQFLRHVVDETEPLYRVVAMITRVIMAKACLVIYHPLLCPSGDEIQEQLSHEVRQRLFVAAIEIIECNHRLCNDPQCKQYRWLSKTYTTWHAISYVLVETCRRPWSPLVERAWQAATGYEGHPVELAKKAEHGSVFLPLRKLFARVRKHRVHEINRLRANQEDARRLEFAERTGSEPARFGPVPGAERIMDEARERWWKLVKNDSASPAPFLNSKAPSVATPGSRDDQSQSPASADARSFLSPPMATGSLAQNSDASYAMDFVGALMAQPSVPITDFWQLGALDPPPQASQPGMQPQQGQRENINQSYMWADSFVTTGGSKLDELLVEDADMGEFNWQDWNQSIRGLELGNTQSQPPPMQPQNGKWP